MTDLETKPRSGRLLRPGYNHYLMHHFIDNACQFFQSPDEFGERGTVLADHERTMVALLRMPFAPFYDTRFIFKWFKTEGGEQPPSEQVELEGAGLQHATKAFRRNNNISRAPRLYYINPTSDILTMECIRGRGLRDCVIGWWTKERMIRLARQMAVVRLAIMTQVENKLGVPRLDLPGDTVGPFCGWMWWGNQKRRFWDQIDRGPFQNTHELILASLYRDRLVAEWMSYSGYMVQEESEFDTYEDMISYLEKTIDNIDRAPRPTHQELFSLNHNDLRLGYNILMRGSKLAGLIDWETAAYDPLSICIMDLTNVTDYDPRIWRENAGPNGTNFYHLPYRLVEDPSGQRLEISTTAGAERKPFPDWELIENHGGPLGEEDFSGDYYPEDISSNDDESIVDAAEMNCDSDADAGEDCITSQASGGHDFIADLVRRGELPTPITDDWYYEPVYALMKEFIHHHRGVGLGPDGEWGRLPEEYSRPLAEWDDPLYWSVTREHFEGRRDQLINPHRAGLLAAKSSRSRASKMKKQKARRRQRQVQTRIDSLGDAKSTREENLPQSDITGRRRAYLTRDFPPERIRPKSPPITQAALRRAPAAIQADWGAEPGHHPVEAPPSGDARVTGVRDVIFKKVMEELRSRPDDGMGVQ